MNSRRSIIAAVIVVRLAIDPERGRQTEPVWIPNSSAAVFRRNSKLLRRSISVRPSLMRRSSRDLLLRLALLPQGEEGPELVERMHGARCTFSARLSSSGIPPVRTMQGTGAFLASRFLLTSSSSAR
jgi:hypothetical protein